MPPLLVRGVRQALADMRGPIILIANLLTEGRGMAGFTAADEARWVSRAIDRPVDVVIANTGRPSNDAIARYAAEHKHPLELGTLDAIHLATALLWKEMTSADLVMATHDAALGLGAHAHGLAVVGVSLS